VEIQYIESDSIDTKPSNQITSDQNNTDIVDKVSPNVDFNKRYYMNIIFSNKATLIVHKLFHFHY